jgi:pimeloyl-ACP methyl ester carboxylesterase
MSSEIGAPSHIGVGSEQIAYHRVGRGPSVALIHGIPTWSYLWRNVIPPLIQDGLEVIAIDLLGYLGNSRVDGRCSTILDVTRYVLRFLKHEPIDHYQFARFNEVLRVLLDDGIGHNARQKASPTVSR